MNTCYAELRRYVDEAGEESGSPLARISEEGGPGLGAKQNHVNRTSVFSAIDLVPTLLDLTGSPHPGGANDDGESLVGEKGELVCCTPFPSMPVSFWDDPDDVKYRKTYFEKFPGVWTHGDFIAITERGSVVVYGRSDTVLNPGGVRIGTAEIYRPVEALAEVVDSLVVGQPWQEDVRVVLFVVLRKGVRLDETLISKLKNEIRTHATPRHVPACILEISDVPRTISGKKVEKAVLQILKGEKVENTAALANPESLDVFKNLRQTMCD